MSTRPETGRGPGDITAWLSAWSGGDRAAEGALWESLHPVLRRLAGRQIRAGGSELQPTELVHEAFLRLREQRRVDWADRGHFLAIAARVIRRVLVDHLRARGRSRRGGDMEVVSLGELESASPGDGDGAVDWLDLHEALRELEVLDARCSRLVELRYFGGLTVEEAAEISGISVPTAVRDWRFARGWLRTRLSARA